MVPRPELSLSSEYAFPTLVSLPWEGWEYGESGNMVKVMDPLLKKKKKSYLQANVLYNSGGSFSSRAFYQNPNQSIPMHPHTPSPCQAWGSG